jgi:hypothetical protein
VHGAHCARQPQPGLWRPHGLAAAGPEAVPGPCRVTTCAHQVRPPSERQVKSPGRHADLQRPADRRAAQLAHRCLQHLAVGGLHAGEQLVNCICHAPFSCFAFPSPRTTAHALSDDALAAAAAGDVDLGGEPSR